MKRKPRGDSEKEATRRVRAVLDKTPPEIRDRIRNTVMTGLKEGKNVHEIFEEHQERIKQRRAVLLAMSPEEIANMDVSQLDDARDKLDKAKAHQEELQLKAKESHVAFQGALSEFAQQVKEAGPLPADFAAKPEVRKALKDLVAHGYEAPRILPDQTHSYREVPRETPEENSVEAYLAVLSNMYHLSKTSMTVDQRREATRVWTWLRDARIFHIGKETYQSFHVEADRFTTEAIVGQEYQPPGSGKVCTTEESKDYVMALFRAAKEVQYPEKFPFPCVFLGYDKGLALSPELSKLRAPSELRDLVAGATLLGHLMTADGFVYSFTRTTLNPDPDKARAFWFESVRYADRWVGELNLEPWILPNFIQLINEHRTFVIENTMPKPQRQSFKDNRKKLGLKDHKSHHLPPPYYTLKIHTQVIQERIKNAYPSVPRGPKAYRSDVRGHERCRIRRGPLPLDTKDHEKLLARGYTVFTDTALDYETHQRLAERGLGYKRSDEWMAVKTSWVEDFQSPKNPNLPYIPAVRVPTKEPKKKLTGSWTEDPSSF